MIVPTKNQNHLPKTHNLYSHKCKNVDRENFLLDQFEIDWNNIIAADKEDINHYIANFMEQINALLDKYMPLKKVSQKDFKRKYKPWITNTILKKMNTKIKFSKIHKM